MADLSNQASVTSINGVISPLQMEITYIIEMVFFRISYVWLLLQTAYHQTKTVI